MAEIFRAATVLPVAPGLPPVIEDGAVACEDGGMGGERTILAVGRFADIKRDHPGAVRDLGDVALAPAVLNSHAHLEMTHLKDRLVRGQGFVPWVRSMLEHALYAFETPLIQRELMRLEARGTAFVADISTRNAPAMAGLLAASGLFFASFQEAIGSVVPEDPASLIHALPPETSDPFGRGVLSTAGHALYSTSAALLRAAKGAATQRGLPFSLHLAEHEEEDSILLTGRSAFLDLLRERGFLTSYDPPGKRPLPLALELGLLDHKTLAVHCVRLSEPDMDALAASGASACLCPRSNEYIGVGAAPAAGLLARGVNVCLGTDGLCSAPDLDVYGELAWLKAHSLPELSLADGVALITRNPARFFALEGRLGSLEPGRLARFSVVPAQVAELFSL